MNFEQLLLQNSEPSIMGNNLILHHEAFPSSDLAEKFKQFPFNCICLIKIKICCDEKTINSIKGTGVMIEKDLVMTVAHNVIDHRAMIQQITNNKKNAIDKSYIKLALYDGQDQGIYDIETIYISEKYRNLRANNQFQYYDYALIKIKPRQQKQLSKSQFPIPLALSTFDKKIHLEIYGYNQTINLKNIGPQYHNNSSIFIKYPFGGQGQLKEKNIDDNKFLYYQIQTDVGTSGSPLLTKIQRNDVFIGLHKARKLENTNTPNFGINMLNAIDQVNQWGYQLYKKPLIFTQKTIQLHKNSSKISKSQIIFYADKGITSIDINVITSYDLTFIRKIMLSGNKINDEGFKYLTKRKFPALESLFIAQNHLEKLSDIEDINWDNISTIKALALNINKISKFPQKIGRLTNLTELWLSYNNISDISEAFIQFCKSRAKELFVHMYRNQIPLNNISIRNAINLIENTHVKCYWEKSDLNK